MCLSLEHQNPSKTSENGLFWSRYTFYRPQTKRLRAREIGLQYKIRKERKQIWGRFSNPWNSNGIEWNGLILLTWSRILMYLPDTVGKRHKKAFKFIGDRNLRLRDSAFVRCKPTHAKMLLVPIKFFFLCWVDYALEGSTFSLSKCDFSRMFHTERSWHTYRFTVVIVSGRQDLPSDASAFSLTSFEA